MLKSAALISTQAEALSTLLSARESGSTHLTTPATSSEVREVVRREGVLVEAARRQAMEGGGGEEEEEEDIASLRSEFLLSIEVQHSASWHTKTYCVAGIFGGGGGGNFREL